MDGHEIENCIRYAMQTAVHKQRNVEQKTLKFYDNLASSMTSPLKILIAGEFKTGKSTFINALLGRVLLKSDVVPTTSVVTYINYGEEDLLYVLFKNEKYMQYPFSDLEELTSENTIKYRDIRNEIAAVYVYVNVPILKEITIMDTPGINVRIERHEVATHNVLEDADCIIWVMSATGAGRKTEYEEISKISGYLKPFIVINRIDLLDPDVVDVEQAIINIGRRISDYCTGYVAVSSYLALQSRLNADLSLWEESHFSKVIDIIQDDYILKKDELCGLRLRQKLNARREVNQKISLDACRQQTKDLNRWLYSNRSLEKIVNLQRKVISRREVQSIIEENVAYCEINQLSDSLTRYAQCLRNAIEESDSFVELFPGNKFQFSQLKRFFERQIKEIDLFKDTCVGSKVYTNWNYINTSIAMLKSNYFQAIHIFDSLEDKLLTNRSEDIKLWTTKMEKYNECVGHILESEILDTLCKYGL